MSIKNKIKAADDIDRVSLTVDEWGVTIEIRSMSVRQRAAFIAANQDGDGQNGRVEALYGQMMITCIYDPETGDLVFDEADLDWLMTEKSGAVIDRIVTRCLEVSGLKEKSVDELGKSYSASPTGTDVDTLNSGTTSS